MSDRTITIDLSTPTRLSDLPVLVARAFEWWVSELQAMLPGRLSGLFPKQPESATLVAGDVIWSLRGGVDVEAAVQLDPSLDDRGLLQQLLEAAPDFSLRRLTVLVPQENVLRRRLELPMMPDADLRSAVELQLDRLSPFKPEDVRFAARVSERDPVDGKLIAEVAIAPRASIEAVETRLSSLGLTPAIMDVEGADGAASGFDLGRPRQQEAPRRALLVNLALVGAVALIWYMAGVAWETAREREIEAWQARIADLRPLAQRSAAMRLNLEAMIEPVNAARAHRPGLSLQVLAELTRLLPDTARLSEVRFEGDSVDCKGMAGNAPALISKLEGSKLFKDVKFRSPVTRRVELNKDSFEITLRLERRSAP